MKTGDKVWIKRDGADHAEVKRGQSGIIVKTYDHPSYDYLSYDVKMDGSRLVWSFEPDSLATEWPCKRWTREERIKVLQGLDPQTKAWLHLAAEQLTLLEAGVIAGVCMESDLYTEFTSQDEDAHRQIYEYARMRAFEDSPLSLGTREDYEKMDELIAHVAGKHGVSDSD